MNSKLKKTVLNLWFQPYTPIIILSLIVYGLYRFGYPPVQNIIKTPFTEKVEPTGTVLADTAEAVIGAMQKLIDLPTDEEPEIVTITDVEKFKDQAFFKKAANGDKLLLYKKNKKAFLFNPRDQKIIDVAPITDASESAQQLQDYCTAIASQSAQIVQTQVPTPTITPPADATSPSPATSPTPTTTQP